MIRLYYREREDLDISVSKPLTHSSPELYRDFTTLGCAMDFIKNNNCFYYCWRFE